MNLMLPPIDRMIDRISLAYDGTYVCLQNTVGSYEHYVTATVYQLPDPNHKKFIL